MIDSELYNITVRKGNFDGEVFFEAKVKELPDVCEYADSFDEAYNLAKDTIETTAEVLLNEGKTMPLPIVDNDTFSGRVTLRMPKSMHSSYSCLAEVEGVSLNQMVINTLSYGIGYKFGLNSAEKMKITLGKETQSSYQAVNANVYQLPVAANGVY